MLTSVDRFNNRRLLEPVENIQPGEAEQHYHAMWENRPKLRYSNQMASSKPGAVHSTVYCRRGAAENHIKSQKTHLAVDRTSGTKATANPLRLFLHTGVYWLM